MKDGQPLNSLSYAVYSDYFSCIQVYKRPNGGSQYGPKHIAVHTLI